MPWQGTGDRGGGSQANEGFRRMYERGNGEWSDDYQSSNGASWTPSRTYEPGLPTPGYADELNHTAPIAAAPYAPVQYRSPSGETEPTAPAVPATPAVGPRDIALDITPEGMAAGVPYAELHGLPMRNRAGNTALGFGVAAILCTGVLFVLFPLGIVFALVALVVGRRGRRRARLGFASNQACATAGVALGTLALLLGGLWSALTAWVVTEHDVDELRSCVTNSVDVGDGARCLVNRFDPQL